MNQELTNQIIDAIKLYPRQLDMGLFSNYDVYTEKWAFCIAGWAIVFGLFDGNQDKAGEWLEVSRTQEITDIASNLLECSQHLFFVSQWPIHLANKYINCNTYQGYAEITIDAINHYNTSQD